LNEKRLVIKIVYSKPDGATKTKGKGGGGFPASGLQGDSELTRFRAGRSGTFRVSTQLGKRIGEEREKPSKGQYTTRFMLFYPLPGGLIYR